MKFGLRERKYAQTKLAIVHVVVTHIESDRDFEDLSNKEICSRVDISDATFYNYFPQRNDIFKYILKLWEIGIRWRAEQRCPDSKGVNYLRMLTSRKHLCGISSVKVFAQMLSITAKEGIDLEVVPLSDAEVYYAFPNMDGVLDIPRKSNLVDVYFENLEYAQKVGEISSDIDTYSVAYSLVGIGMSAMIFLKNDPDAENKVQKVIEWHTNLILDALVLKK